MFFSTNGMESFFEMFFGKAEKTEKLVIRPMTPDEKSGYHKLEAQKAHVKELQNELNKAIERLNAEQTIFTQDIQKTLGPEYKSKAISTDENHIYFHEKIAELTKSEE